MSPAKSKPPASKVVCSFDPDGSVPADFHGNRYCRRCGLPGRPGDERHPHGALPPVPAATRELEARRLGEPLDGVGED